MAARFLKNVNTCLSHHNLMLMRYSLLMNLSRNAAYLMKSKGGVSFLSAIEKDLGNVPFFGAVGTGEYDEYSDEMYDEISAPRFLVLGGKEWRRIGGGADRVVYQCGRLVLKFPSGYLEAEEDANEIEFDVYQKLIGNPVVRYFAPSVALLYGYTNGPVLVAHFVSKTREQIAREQSKSGYLWDFLELRLPESVEVGDLHCENYIGHTVIDYGRFYVRNW